MRPSALGELLGGSLGLLGVLGSLLLRLLHRALRARVENVRDNHGHAGNEGRGKDPHEPRRQAQRHAVGGELHAGQLGDAVVLRRVLEVEFLG